MSKTSLGLTRMWKSWLDTQLCTVIEYSSVFSSDKMLSTCENRPVLWVGPAMVSREEMLRNILPLYRSLNIYVLVVYRWFCLEFQLIFWKTRKPKQLYFCDYYFLEMILERLNDFSPLFGIDRSNFVSAILICSNIFKTNSYCI